MIAAKPERNYMMITLCLILCFVYPLRGDQGTLAELYRSSKARLVPELIIDASSLPKDVLFVGLTSISSDSEGNIYVLDVLDNNIKKFDSAGRFIKVIGRKGQGPGEFNMPYQMAFAGDRLVVYEAANSRLSLLTLDGTFIKNVPLSTLTGVPVKIKGLNGGDVVLETKKTYYGEQDKPQDFRIDILAPDLKPKNEIYFQSILRANYLIIDSKRREVPQPYCPDIHWDVSPDGKILIGFAEKYEIGIFSAGKERLGTIARAWSPVKVTDADKKKWFEGMGVVSDNVTKLGAPDYLVQATKFPRFKPAFDEVLWDPEGNILVHPILKEGSGQFYDAFTPRGKFIARVELVGSAEHFYPGSKQVCGGFIWAYDIDADGYYRVVKWRLSKF